MISIGRNRRLAPTSALNVYASVGTHCDRERSRKVLASRLWRSAFGLAAIAALADQDLQTKLRALAAEPAPPDQNTPERLAAFWAAERDKWGRIIRKSNIRLE